MNKIEEELLEQIQDLHSIPQGSYSIRRNGESEIRASGDDVQIVSKTDGKGIDVFVKAGVKGKSVHIPVLVTVSNFSDLVYNDFYIGDNAEVTIVAGCGIHNPEEKKSEHDGIHCFHIGNRAKVKYIEKHLGLGKGARVLNPITKINLGKHSSLEMEAIQLGGVSHSNRKTSAVLGEKAQMTIKEKIMTDDKEVAKTNFLIELRGQDSSVEVISRSVAKGESKQIFSSTLKGKNECFGHVECDGIVLDNAIIESCPKVSAQNVNATLIHEAAIGKIAGDQIIKLQSLGLSMQEAQNEIIKGFLG